MINNMRAQLVMAKALAYAIRVIENLPVRWQEQSDKEDMKKLLAEEFGVFVSIATEAARYHMDSGAKNDS